MKIDSPGDPYCRINITPLIDVCLVLVIVFVLVSLDKVQSWKTITAAAAGAPEPQQAPPKPAAPAATPMPVQIDIGKDYGKVWVRVSAGGREVGSQDLTEPPPEKDYSDEGENEEVVRLLQACKDDFVKGRPAAWQLTVGPGVRHGEVIRVMDAGDRAGIPSPEIGMRAALKVPGKG